MSEGGAKPSKRQRQSLEQAEPTIKQEELAAPEAGLVPDVDREVLVEGGAEVKAEVKDEALMTEITEDQGIGFTNYNAVLQPLIVFSDNQVIL